MYQNITPDISICEYWYIRGIISTCRVHLYTHHISAGTKNLFLVTPIKTGINMRSKIITTGNTKTSSFITDQIKVNDGTPKHLSL